MESKATEFETYMEHVLDFETAEELERNLTKLYDEKLSREDDAEFAAARSSISSLGDFSYFGALRPQKISLAAIQTVKYLQFKDEALNFDPNKTKTNTRLTEVVYTVCIDRLIKHSGRTNTDDPLATAADITTVAIGLDLLVSMAGIYKKAKITDRAKKVLKDKYLDEVDFNNDPTGEKKKAFVSNLEKEKDFNKIKASFESKLSNDLKSYEKTELEASRKQLSILEENVAHLEQRSKANPSDVKLAYDLGSAVADLDLAQQDLKNKQDLFASENVISETSRRILQDDGKYENLRNLRDVFSTDLDLSAASKSINKYSKIAGAADSVSHGLSMGATILSNIIAANQEEGISPLTQAFFASAATDWTVSAANTMLKTFKPGAKSASAALDIVGAGTQAVAVATELAALSQGLKNPDLTDKERSLLQAEVVLQSVNLGLGTLTGVLAGVQATVQVGTQSAAFLAKAVPILGAVVSVVSAFNPAQWAAFENKRNHVDDVRERDDYSSDRLGNLLEKTALIEEAMYSTSTAITAATGIIASGLALGGVTAGVGALVGFIGGGISALITGLQQHAIENAAKHEREAIESEFGSIEGYFQGSFEEGQDILRDQFKNFFENALENGFDTATGLSSQRLTASDLELAGIIKAQEKLGVTAKHFSDQYFGDGEWKRTVLDAVEGQIDLNNVSGKKHYLTFLTPLMAPGNEVRKVVDSGKYKNKTSLELVLKDAGWNIKDNGEAHTTFDVGGIVTSYQRAKDTVNRNLNLTIQAGGGDDVVFAGKAPLEIYGGRGEDTVSYTRIPKSDLAKGLKVEIINGGIHVTKEIAKGSKYYKESIESAKISHGKRTEELEYRSVKVAEKWSETNETDILRNVEVFQGSSKDDDLNFLHADEMRKIFGFDGNDRVEAGKSVSLISAGSGDDTIILSDQHFDVLHAAANSETDRSRPTAGLVVSGDGGNDILVLSNRWIEAVAVNAQIKSISQVLAARALEESGSDQESVSQASDVVESTFKNDYGTTFARIAIGDVETIKTTFSDSLLGRMGDYFFDSGKFRLDAWGEALRVALSTQAEGVAQRDFSISVSFENLNSPINVRGGDLDEIIKGTDTRGQDFIYAGGGQDKIYGSAGNDRIFGGTGRDEFIYENTNIGQDIIFDFSNSFNGLLPYDQDILIINTNVQKFTYGFQNEKSADYKLVFEDTGASITIKDYLTIDNFYNNPDGKVFYSASNSSLIRTHKEMLGDSLSPIQHAMLLRQVDEVQRVLVKNTNLPDGDVYSNDIFRGTSNADSFNGHGGHDLFESSAGRDKYDGGIGFDIVSYESKPTAVTIDLLGLGTGIGYQYEYRPEKRDVNHPSSWHQQDELKSIEGVEGSVHNDHIFGDDNANYLEGGSGNDELTGRGGEDSFIFRIKHGNDRILDFDATEDSLQFFDIDARSVSISDVGGNAVITTSVGHTIILEDVRSTEISDDNMYFL